VRVKASFEVPPCQDFGDADTPQVVLAVGREAALAEHVAMGRDSTRDRFTLALLDQSARHTTLITRSRWTE
jgi:hypothetical protein